MRKRNNRRLTPEELNIQAWKYPDEGAFTDETVRKRYFSRKTAINLYIDGATDSDIKLHAGIGISQTIRLIKERCLAIHSDGEVWGWRGIVPWERINSYHRKSTINVDKFGQGAAGALNAVFNAQPMLREQFNKRILSAGSNHSLSIIKRNRQSHWHWFLGKLQSLGYETEMKWPFNTKNLGYVSVCRYVNAVLNENPEAAALITGGSDNKKKLLTGDGVDRPIQHLYQRVEMDAHKLDARFSILLPQPSGGYIQKIVHRLWVIVILEVESRAVIGYHLSMRKEVSKVDVLRAIKMALTRWRKPLITFAETAFLPKANLPSSASEKFIGVCCSGQVLPDTELSFSSATAGANPSLN
jgi:hypothetical protein